MVGHDEQKITLFDRPVLLSRYHYFGDELDQDSPPCILGVLRTSLVTKHLICASISNPYSTSFPLFPLLVDGNPRKILRPNCLICPDISCFPMPFILEFGVDKKWRLKMPKHVTMRSLADELGLAESAVSRALSGKKGVSEQTRRRIIAAARRHGYVAKMVPGLYYQQK